MLFMYLLVVSILLSGVLIFMLLIYGVATEDGELHLGTPVRVLAVFWVLSPLASVAAWTMMR